MMPFSYGKCSYTYIANIISTYTNPAPALRDRTGSSLKPVGRDTVVTGTRKNDDDKYSLKNLLKR